MKNLLPLTCIIVVSLFLSFFSCLSQPVIRIIDDELKREYKLLFSAPEEIKINVKLLNSQNQILVDEDYNEKAFIKKFTLGEKAALGRYKWAITYGDEIFEKDFEIRSIKKLLKESVSATLDDLLNLKLIVRPNNKDPVNVFLYNGFDVQIEYFFWDPNVEGLEKVINLASYDAYEIKLEILQYGEPILVETFTIY